MKLTIQQISDLIRAVEYADGRMKKDICKRLAELLPALKDEQKKLVSEIQL